ncbi:MAG: DNA polymerase II [Ignavibacteriaceae bacterium]
MMKTTDVFILTGEWQDVRGHNVLRFIGKSIDGTTEVLITKNHPVFFIERNTVPFDLPVPFKRKQLRLQTFDFKEVDVLYFNTQSDLLTAAVEIEKQGIKTYEADIDPVRRYLMERFINAQIKVTGERKEKNGLISYIDPEVKPCEFTPDLLCASIDIETGENNTKLYSIAAHLTSRSTDEKIVFMVGDDQQKKPPYLHFFQSEKEIIQAFINWLRQADPDLIIGWHVIGFDLMFLESKCKDLNIPFEIARSGGRVSLRKRKPGGFFASVSGRVVIDGPAALRASFYTFEDYKLETVAQELLSEGKTITPDQDKVEEIERLFEEDKISLAEYNLKDAALVTDIFRRAGLIELSIRRSQLSGLLMDQLGMMTYAFDHFFLPRLHREGFVAPNVKDIHTSGHAAGGHVLEPTPGIYKDVVVLDFKSLYPSIIQTFKIDPLSRLLSHIDPVATPKGIKFSSTKHYLPGFIDQLISQRNLAKQNNDIQLAQAIKILMNSFYGVMGSYGCRFYHPDLPTAITGTGQFLLLGSKEFLENKKFKVVYGDTDSLFIRLKEGEGEDAETNGKRIAETLNNYWSEKLKNDFNVNSYLEIEFEKYYRQFIITPARSGELGAKKRYAGLLVEDGIERIEFVGLEFVRSDWTRLAKDFQIELYKRIFNNEELDDWLRSFVNKVNNGEFDDKLVYRKRLRKDVEEYTKNIPQHVRAAKMLDQTSGTVYYVITKRGPVPVELKHNDIDYQHYIEKQLKPIADSVLSLLGKSFDEIVSSSQLSFF